MSTGILHLMRKHGIRINRENYFRLSHCGGLGEVGSEEIAEYEEALKKYARRRRIDKSDRIRGHGMGIAHPGE
jgi:hypothetical protein